MAPQFQMCGSFDRRFYTPGLRDDSFYQFPSLNAMATDAKGNLYVGGRFTSIDNVVTNNIARYDIATDTWSALAHNGLNGGFGPDITVEALAISGNNLFVSGRFQGTGDGAISFRNIARYDIAADAWSPLGGSGNGLSNVYDTEGDVRALAISGNDLFVGGQFTRSTNNVTTNLKSIARYNIAADTFSPLTGNGLSDGNAFGTGYVNALLVSGSDLFVGGYFKQTVDGATTNLNRIARFNTATNTWSAFAGNGLRYGNVNALAISGNFLFVGGSFNETDDGTTAINLFSIARYDIVNNTWLQTFAGSGLKNNGFLGSVEALTISGNDLYVGGQFTSTADNSLTNLGNIARYDVSGNAWSPLTGSGLNGNSVFALLIVGSDLIVGGRFTETANGATKNINNIARYNSGAWKALGANNGIALDRIVNAVAVDANGNIYVGGNFTQAAGGATTNLNHIARFNVADNTWSALNNNGLNGNVNALAISGDTLYVGGDFSMTGDNTMPLNRIARYNITSGGWSALTGSVSNGNGLNNSVYALTISGSSLFVGGDFTQTVGDSPTNMNRIAGYDTAANTWSALTGSVPNGNGLNNSVYALTISGSSLFVGGGFTQTIGDSSTTLNRIARYDTSTNIWSALANNGLNSFVRALYSSGSNLLARGDFSQTFDGAKSLDRLAHYHVTNNVWTSLTEGSDADAYQAATTLGAAQPSGTDLAVGGSFKPLSCGTAQSFTRVYFQQWSSPAAFSGDLTATDWHDGANWTFGTAPAANSNAVIPTGAGNINITSADVTMNDLNLSGGTLTVGANRTLTINGILSLNGGKITGTGTVTIADCKQDGIMGGGATSYIQTPLVRCVNNTGTFNFPVGTANAYSPVQLSNVAGNGNFTIKANEGAYSGTAAGLPANRLQRFWDLTNGGITSADVRFNYLAGDVISGTENNYKLFRINGGTAQNVGGTINTVNHSIFISGVTSFSPWTLAESAPTAAGVMLGGRVTIGKGRGISKAIVTLTDADGVTRTALTNPFGYYRFEDVPAGETYIISARHKQYRFSPTSQIINANENFADINFAAETYTSNFYNSNFYNDEKRE
ncbi:MAG: beta strand repeat-containing protein [Pyrinomonadaceae bacterium]